MPVYRGSVEGPTADWDPFFDSSMHSDTHSQPETPVRARPGGQAGRVIGVGVQPPRFSKVLDVTSTPGQHMTLVSPPGPSSRPGSLVLDAAVDLTTSPYSRRQQQFSFSRMLDHTGPLSGVCLCVRVYVRVLVYVCLFRAYVCVCMCVRM